MGAVINMEPKLFNGIVAQVPFVDVVTTMLDEDIPLTTGEYDEWGNPNDKEYYDYMKSYSPYDNIEEKDYPNILITTGFHDSQVQYWEPAKWTAKLRELKTDNKLLLFKTDMSSGHGGASGRFESLKDDAFEYAFLLKLENKTEVELQKLTMTEQELWKKVEAFFQKNFDMEPNPPIETILFLIGIQELGSGQQKYSKDDKLNLIHIAVCRLLEPYGYYKFNGYDDGWPQYEQLQEVPELKPNEQSVLMRKSIIQYFIDEDLFED